MTVFSSIENGIYTAVAASGALLIVRIARPRGAFLGRVLIHHDSKDKIYREVFVPIASTQPAYGRVINPHIKIELPAPGVVIYRPEESVLYPNSSFITGNLVDYIKANTRRGKDMTGVKVGHHLHSIRKGHRVDSKVLLLSAL